MESPAGNGGGQLSVPPGFRFHPTEEELLYYYLHKKVSFEPIDLDVIREIDLNKLEPWDLKDKCRIGSGPQNEWYFFSHKDKKYPTGTRTNRATAAGFWKATGRDKAIHLSNSKRIGMRKTLVFYTGRAPHGQKTDWIMHEYRLDLDDNDDVQEEGWVVCRVFKKKSHQRGFHPEVGDPEDRSSADHLKTNNAISGTNRFDSRQSHHHLHHRQLQTLRDYTINTSMHLPQLFSQESAVSAPSFMSLSNFDIECSQNLPGLASNNAYCGGLMQQQGSFSAGDWSFLDKLLASHYQNPPTKYEPLTTNQVLDLGSLASKFPFQYLGSEADILKFSK